MEMTNTPTQEEIAAMETTLSNYYSYDSQGCWGAASHSPHQKIDLEGDMSAVESIPSDEIYECKLCGFGHPVQGGEE